MRGPTDQLREQPWTRAQTIDSEEELTELLNEIEMALRDDLEPLGRRSSRRRAISCAATSRRKKSAAESWGLPRVLPDGTPVSASKPVATQYRRLGHEGGRTG